MCIFAIFTWVSLAEWSKALASGASPQGRGLEPHRVQVPDPVQVPVQVLDVLLSTMCVFFAIFTWVSLAEWSKALASGASSQGRGLEAHRGSGSCCVAAHVAVYDVSMFAIFTWVSLAEWSKELASGASPQGRGLEPHRVQVPVQVPDVLLPVLLSIMCVFCNIHMGQFGRVV